MVVDTSTRSTHGHADALSVLLAGAGSPLWSTAADHISTATRTIVRLPGPRPTTPSSTSGAQAAEGAIRGLVEMDAEDYSLVSGEVDLSAGATGRRVILLLKPDLLVVVDMLAATDAQSHLYSLLYHLPPHAEVTAGRSGVVTAGDARLGYSIAAGQPLTASIVRGQTAPLLGWVTTAGTRSGPVLRFDQLGGGSAGWRGTSAPPADARGRRRRKSSPRR